MTEEQLIHKLNDGDVNVFQKLYKEYYVPLCVYARHFTKTKELTEEVVQDVFLKIWEQRGTLKIEESLKAYLFTAVRNQCLNHLKHLQVVRKFSEYHTRLLKEAEDYYTITQENGDSILIAGELSDSLSKAIDSLPEKCREIFVMSRFEGLKHQDIAKNLGVTINTVQRQTSIALEKLRLALQVYLSALLLLIFKYLF